MISKRWKIGMFYTKWCACHATLPTQLAFAALPGRLATACLTGFIETV